MDYSELLQFVKTGLAGSVSLQLQSWMGHPKAKNYWNPNTGFFYEATVQGQIVATITQTLGGDLNNWLVLQEQLYPGLPDQRADVWVVSAHDESMVIEVKADFNLGSAQDDYGKILVASPRKFDDGFVFFCSLPDKVEAWEKLIETNPQNEVFARGIAAQPA